MKRVGYKKKKEREKNHVGNGLSSFHVSSLVSGVFLPGMTSASKPVPQGVKFLQSQIQGSHNFQLSFTLEEISFVKLQLLKKDRLASRYQMNARFWFKISDKLLTTKPICIPVFCPSPPPQTYHNL